MVRPRGCLADLADLAGLATYIRDIDGYVIGFNDKAALQASDLGQYAE
ncbi:hypothetical protein AB0A69_25005 [Streptomyces sp. NPDC045431]